jgi:tRNA (adenine57-N1/adenine58-N1)-methyltransferase catalytic subunit
LALSDVVQLEDLVMLVSPTNKTIIFKVNADLELHTHRGIIKHNELVGKPWGSQIQTHLGNKYFLLQPGLGEILRETSRNTQIMYPKDIGFVFIMMGIGPGTRVIEAGTGSGALTAALAWAIGETGQVYSYENRPEMQNLARRNLQKLGFLDRVSFRLRDISNGFDEEGVDALFLDVPNPYDYLAEAHHSMKNGGFFGSILPTTNQVTRLLHALYSNNFAFPEVCEILLRYYKPNPERLRPTDRMVAHTGFLVFARRINQEVIEQIQVTHE